MSRGKLEVSLYNVHEENIFVPPADPTSKEYFSAFIPFLKLFSGYKDAAAGAIAVNLNLVYLYCTSC